MEARRNGPMDAARSAAQDDLRLYETPAGGIDGLLGQVEDLGDLGVGVRLGDQLDDLLGFGSAPPAFGKKLRLS
jgi:hypothetical protein